MGITLSPPGTRANRSTSFGRVLSAVRRLLGRPATAATDVSAVEVIYLHVVAAVLVVGWVGLVLAEFGVFSLGAVMAGTLVVVAASLTFRWPPATTRPTWSWGAVSALIVVPLSIGLFVPPAELIIGGADPGVYVSTGAHIARTGSIVISDRELVEMPPDLRVALFDGRSRLAGFHIADPERGHVQPHGFHLYPTMLAILYALGGLTTSLWATPLIAMLALAGFFLLTRRLFGAPVALLATVLLSANPGVIWFARYPAAENLVQLWLFGGLLAFVLMLDTRSRRLAVLAGLALGASHLTKIEVIVLPVVLALFFASQWAMRRWRAEYGFFLAAYALMIVHAALHAHFVATVYFYHHLDLLVLRGGSIERLVVPVGIVAIAFVVLVLRRDQIGRILMSPTAHRGSLVLAAGGVVLLAGFAYYVRPRLGPNVDVIAATPVDVLYGWVNRTSYVIIGWYVSPIALLLAPLGLAAALTRGVSGRTVVVLGVLLLEALVHLIDARVNPVHFWAARRYIPAVFPAFALGSAVLLWQLQVRLWRRWPEALLPICLATVVLLSTLGGWLPFRSHVELRGAIGQIGHLASIVPEGSIVVFDDTMTATHLTTPLQHLWERPSFILAGSGRPDGLENALIADWLARGRDVYYVRDESPASSPTSGDGAAEPLKPWGHQARLVGSSAIDLPYVAAAIGQRPEKVVQLTYDLRIYQISRPADRAR